MFIINGIQQCGNVINLLLNLCWTSPIKMLWEGCPMILKASFTLKFLPVTAS